MKNFLIVVESEKSAQFMLAKAAKLLPKNITILCFVGGNSSIDEEKLRAETDRIKRNDFEVYFYFDSVASELDKEKQLELALSNQSFDMVMLHRPILGKEVQDLSLVKSLLRGDSKAPIYLCGDKRWNKTIKVLATVDVSDEHASQIRLNENVLSMTVELGEVLNAHLDILSVIPVSRISSELDIFETDEILMTKGDSAKRKLAQLVNDSGIASEPKLHVSAGAPSKEISSVSQRLKADIVVVGNVGRTGIKGLVLGNTAEKILKRLAVDALIVSS